jgi:hypothetical protein
MVSAKKFLPVLFLGGLLAGCSTTITNLTPKQEHRNANNFYDLEVALSSTQETLRWSSIKPYVIIGSETYPMKFTPLMTNRWETLVPVKPGENVIYYRYKFDFDHNVFGNVPQPDSKLSPKYRLQIIGD